MIQIIHIGLNSSVFFSDQQATPTLVGLLTASVPGFPAIFYLLKDSLIRLFFPNLAKLLLMKALYTTKATMRENKEGRRGK
jgi:hypothetical protein